MAEPASEVRAALRPGPGWRHIAGAVWEHQCGIRAHVRGCCGFPPDIIWGCQYPDVVEMDRFIAANGGNRKRGVLAWSLKMFRERFGGKPPSGLGGDV